MSYLLAEIVLYLLIAGLIGFGIGWSVRSKFEKKSSEESTSVSSPKSTKVEEVATKLSKEEPSGESEEVKEDQNPPALLTEARAEGKDKLSSMKGIGPVIEKKLNELGIYHFNQIASWNRDQEKWIETQLAFPKSIAKEEWVKQAKELSK